MFIDASAETYEKLSVLTTQSFFGNDIPFTYVYDGVTYSETFHYITTATGVNSINIENNTVMNSVQSASQYDYLIYRTYADYGRPWQTIQATIPISLRYSGGARGAFGGVGILGVGDSTSPLNEIAVHPDNFMGSNYAPPMSLDPDYFNYCELAFSYSGGYVIPFRMIPYDVQNAQYDSISMSLISDGLGQYYFVIATPFIYGDMSSIPEYVETTAPAVTTVPTTDITVNVDLTETNGILGTIADILGGLVNGIKNLFVPDNDDILSFKNALANLLNETFGGIPALYEQLQTTTSSLFQVSAAETLTFPDVKIPNLKSGGQYTIIASRQVPLKPHADKFAAFYSWVETFINIVATIAVVNMSMSACKKVIVGEVIVDVD